MQKMIKKIGQRTAALAGVASALALPLMASAAADYNKFLSQTGLSSQFSGTSDTSLLTMIGTGIGILLGVLGVILVLIFIYAGFIWMTAQGDEKKVGKAKQMIYNAIIGLVIVFAAYAITEFVLGQLNTISG